MRGSLCPYRGGSVVTWDPLNKDSLVTLSNGNLTATRTGSGNTGYSSGLATVGHTSGRRYFEILVNIDTYPPSILLGIARTGVPLNNFIGFTADSFSLNGSNGNFYSSNNGNPGGPTYAGGDILGFAVLIAAGGATVSFYKNNVFASSKVASVGGAYFPAFTITKNSAPAHQITGHFAASSFIYSPPAGFSAWQ